MSTPLLKKSFLRWLAMLTALFLVPSLPSQETGSKPTVVQIHKTARGTSYEVDSKPAGSKPTDDLLHVLNHVADKHGMDHPVLVFIDPQLPIDEIWNFSGVAAK